MNFSKNEIPKEANNIPQKISNKEIIGRLAIFLVVFMVLLFGSAGSFRWPEAWVYITVQFSFSIALASWLKKNNPDLLRERMTFLKRSARGWDKMVILLSTPISLGLFIISGLDAVRYQWSKIPYVIKITGFTGIVASFFLIFSAMRENTYLSRFVEIQEDRGHKVIMTGPYQYVRHPMYVGVIVWLFCLPLALGSLYALTPSALLAILIIVRTILEDKTLYRELPGYKAYAKKVKYRLLPGIW